MYKLTWINPNKEPGVLLHHDRDFIEGMRYHLNQRGFVTQLVGNSHVMRYRKQADGYHWHIYNRDKRTLPFVGVHHTLNDIYIELEKFRKLYPHTPIEEEQPRPEPKPYEKPKRNVDAASLNKIAEDYKRKLKQKEMKKKQQRKK